MAVTVAFYGDNFVTFPNGTDWRHDHHNLVILQGSKRIAAFDSWQYVYQGTPKSIRITKPKSEEDKVAIKKEVPLSAA